MEARGLSVGYGSEPVLGALTFAFEAGGVNVILGPGGAGKSTLLRALGADPGASAPPWARGRLTRPVGPPAFMAQKPRPRPEPLAHRLAGGDREGAARALREIWPSAPEVVRLLEPALALPMDQLPYSETRLAELTAVLTTDRWVLLDEPEVGLEDELRESMVRCLAHQRGRRTVVLATHHLQFARALADYALLLSDGTMIECGPNPPFFDRPRRARTRRFVTMGS